MKDALDKLQVESTLPFFNTRDLVRLSQTSTKASRIFQPALKQSRPVHQLLNHVVRGEHREITEILENNSQLLVQKSIVFDRGRLFEHISPFEYSLWALDTQTLGKMIHCLPQNEEGLETLEQLIAQLDKVQTEGITYILDGKNITESYYNFNKYIMKELDLHIQSIRSPGTKNWDEIHQQWVQGVGRSQKLLPTHIFQEYLSEKPFYPIPNFISHSTIAFCETESKQIVAMLGFNSDSLLGIEYALCKGASSKASPRPQAPILPPKGTVAELDFNSLRTLFTNCLTYCLNLKEQIEKTNNSLIKIQPI